MPDPNNVILHASEVDAYCARAGALLDAELQDWQFMPCEFYRGMRQVGVEVNTMSEEVLSDAMRELAGAVVALRPTHVASLELPAGFRFSRNVDGALTGIRVRVTSCFYGLGNPAFTQHDCEERVRFDVLVI